MKNPSIHTYIHTYCVPDEKCHKTNRQRHILNSYFTLSMATRNFLSSRHANTHIDIYKIHIHTVFNTYVYGIWEACRLPRAFMSQLALSVGSLMHVCTYIWPTSIRAAHSIVVYIRVCVITYLLSEYLHVLYIYTYTHICIYN